MTVAQGRLCLQGLEWSSICCPEAGSVPTVPWQEKRSAQSASTAWIFTGGDGKTGGLQYHVGVKGALRRRGDESGTGCFILFWYHKDMAFAVCVEQIQT